MYALHAYPKCGMGMGWFFVFRYQVPSKSLLIKIIFKLYLFQQYVAYILAGCLDFSFGTIENLDFSYAQIVIHVPQ